VIGRAVLRRWVLAAAVLAVAAGSFGFLWQRSTFVDPRPTTMLTDRNGVFIGQIGWGEPGYGYWPVETVPRRVEAAILALEDRRFYEHPGVDPLAVLRAFASNLTNAHRVSGASTLAMQVARMQHPEARDYGAKVVEMATAMLMTARYGREGVLRQYLRLMPLGQNSHGIAHAARWYFDKPVADLSWAEIAFLSAIPQAPAAMNPGSPKGLARAILRGRHALDRLHDQGVLDAVAFAEARDDIGHLTPSYHPERPADALHVLLLTEALLKDQPPQERVRSTIDLGIEGRVTAAARKRLDALRGEGAQQLAVMVLDPKSAEVLALVGSGRYAGADAGMIDYATRPRSPGSALKPFIYALALERGEIAPNTILTDDPDNGTGIENADRRFLGPLLPRQALGNSRNVPAAKLVRLTGLARTHWFLGSLGLQDDSRPAERYGLTIAVGGMPTRLDWLVAAYDALADDGELKPLRWYDEEALPAPRRVLRVETAREITAFLADPMARLPSFARMSAEEYPFPVAVKTGTSQGYRDAWVVAYSDRYLVGVWVGRPDGRPMSGLSGATSAAMVAHDILIDLHGQDSDGQADGEFRMPGDLTASAVCAETGTRDDGHCDHILTEFGPSAGQPAAVPIPLSTPSQPAPLRIANPVNHARFIRNPETPSALDFLSFRARPGSGERQVVWYVDGKPFQLADADAPVHWPLRPGWHRIELHSAYGDVVSAPVDFEVR
jgi:penicillin-binding protein 1C